MLNRDLLIESDLDTEYCLTEELDLFGYVDPRMAPTPSDDDDVIPF